MAPPPLAAAAGGSWRSLCWHLPSRRRFPSRPSPTPAIRAWSRLPIANRTSCSPRPSSALGLAAAAYVRPIAYFLPIVVALCLIAAGVRLRHQRRLRQTLGHVVVLLVVAMSLTGLWRVRNWIEADYRGFSAISGVNSYFY